ncbi:hypothetical protein NDU88_000507 [Pleurodeles waltl]|uniref:Uncharacterized protein n=1 Tax=Pleurodeles waltl TaxID=8319 RepID=A0AAV7Q5W9_PLEWA|nr:hypothetical protein NDU88_000507 [Pleurodeles waltl]
MIRSIAMRSLERESTQTESQRTLANPIQFEKKPAAYRTCTQDVHAGQRAKTSTTVRACYFTLSPCFPAPLVGANVEEQPQCEKAARLRWHMIKMHAMNTARQYHKIYKKKYMACLSVAKAAKKDIWCAYLLQKQQRKRTYYGAN